MEQKVALFTFFVLTSLFAYGNPDAADKTYCGTTSEFINNDDGLYEGNLRPYFKNIWFDAKNLNHPYHNFRHMMHVTWLCSDACRFYVDQLSKREMRNLLIAAIFHDFDHLGKKNKDSVNIKLAIEGLEKHILPEDRPYFDDIKTIIEATEFPYKPDSGILSLSAQIIRDADLSQSFSTAWLQQVVFGLAAEWNKEPIEVLRDQGSFHRHLQPITAWGKSRWPQAQIDEKIAEAARILAILEE